MIASSVRSARSRGDTDERNATWLLILPVLLLDVVTIVVPLFEPRVRWFMDALLTLFLLSFLWLCWRTGA